MQNIYIAHGKTLAEQYFEVGRINATYINKNVERNKRKRSKKHALRKQLLTRIYKRLTTEKIFSEFHECLRAWADGANITVMEAIELLDDNTGCQTVMGRYKNGVVLIHTEEELEDIKERMTAPQIMAFTIEGETKYSLVYNNLLPGAAVYGWGSNYAIAIDALFLTEEGVNESERPILANIVAWLVWRNKQKDLTIEMVSKLVEETGDCVDGYTLNIVFTKDNEVTAYKMTFARQAREFEELATKAGSSLRQLNIIEPKYIEQARPIANYRLPYRQFYRGYWNYYKERLKIIDNDIAQYSPYLEREIESNKETGERIIREIAGPLSKHYMNEVVGAVCTTLIEPTKISTTIGIVEEEKLKTLLNF